jgi:SAM-dependent methyltransferase
MWPGGVTDFAEEGREQVNLMIGLGKLSPEARMVEVGCGSGLRARSLTDWLGPGGLYDGLDSDARAVAWCESAYAHRMDFEFAHHASLDLPLPFDDATKDFVLAWAVLPQATPELVVHLLRESRRILLPEGALFASAYLLDAPAIEAVDRGGTDPAFADRTVRGAQAPDGTYAQDEEWLLDRVAEAGFKTVGIRHGTWCGHPDGRSVYDILVARL